MADKNVSDEVKKQMSEIRQWINGQPHFPKNIDDKLVLRFLHSCYYDLERAKKAAELFFTIRSNAPELINNRDPLSPSIQKTLKIVNLANYPISGNRNLWIWQLNDPGLENYDYLQDARLFFLTTDAWLLSNEDLEEEDIVLMDVKDLSLKFITKFNVSIAKKLSKYQEEAMPIRLTGVHIINAPPVIDKLYALMKPFLKPDMTNMIHFHTPKSTTLYDYINKEDLPVDYGGTKPSMETFMVKSVELVMSQREVFLQENLWASEKKSKKDAKTPDSATDIGSFRTLAID